MEYETFLNQVMPFFYSILDIKILLHQFVFYTKINLIYIHYMYLFIWSIHLQDDYILLPFNFICGAQPIRISHGSSISVGFI